MGFRRVLVVEDEALLRGIIVRNLVSRGHAVREVASGAAALEALMTEIPDLLLLDINLPDCSGWDVLRGLAARGIAVAADAAEALDGIKKPGLAAHGEIEATVAVGHDVEACGFLLGDDAGNGVQILFAEQGIAERRLEGAAGQAPVKPKRPRVGAGDGGGQHHIARDRQHGKPPSVSRA